MDAKDQRIAELTDELRRRDERIQELVRERDEERALAAERREYVEDCRTQIERWIEAFEMTLDDKGVWTWRASFAEGVEWYDKYVALLRDWNRFVTEYNAMVDLVNERRLAGTLAKREPGRPLAATAEQRAEVYRLHDEGVSLREIASVVGVGFQTVRTLVGKIDGSDRTSRKLSRIKADRMRMAAWKARKRTRDALPKSINETLARGKDLLKETRRQ